MKIIKPKYIYFLNLKLFFEVLIFYIRIILITLKNIIIFKE